jgi:hypothetical protein
LSIKNELREFVDSVEAKNLSLKNQSSLVKPQVQKANSDDDEWFDDEKRTVNNK